MTENIGVKFVSWNCRGLHTFSKIKQVMSRLKQLQSKIVFLQETHLMPKDICRIHVIDGQVRYLQLHLALKQEG